MDQYYVESGYVDDNYFTYIADASVNLSSNYTITVIPESVAGITRFESSFTISATPTVNRSTQITLSTIVTLNEQAAKVKTSSANLDSSFTQSANVNQVYHSSASLSTNLSLTSYANYKLSGIANLNSLYNINEISNRIIQSSSSLSSQFSLYDVGNIKTGGSALLFDYASISISPNAIKAGIINYNTNYELTTTASSVKLAEVYLSSSFTIFEYGVVPTFQYVYKIKSESRLYKILPETRIYKVRK